MMMALARDATKGGGAIRQVVTGGGLIDRVPCGVWMMWLAEGWVAGDGLLGLAARVW